MLDCHVHSRVVLEGSIVLFGAGRTFDLGEREGENHMRWALGLGRAFGLDGMILGMYSAQGGMITAHWHVQTQRIDSAGKDHTLLLLVELIMNYQYSKSFHC